MRRRPEWGWVRLAWRLSGRGAAVLVLVTAGMTGLVVVTYSGATADPGAAALLRELAANPAVRTLFGEPLALNTPGGFTTWRTGTIVALLLGGWAIAAVVRLTRGEEQAGRWSLLLIGPVRMSTAVATQVAVVMAAVAAAGLAIFVALVVTGTPAGGAAVHATGIALTGMFFAAVAALAAQVFDDRAGAIVASAAAALVALLLRMLGDGWPALAALQWATPLGLTELSRAYAGDRWPPLLVLAAGVVVAGTAAAVTASRRDVGAGLVVTRPSRRPRTYLLGSVSGFAVRRTLRPLAGWAAGIGTYFLLVGLVATSMLDLLRSNPQLADLAGQAGFGELTSIEGYVGVLSAIVAVPVGVFSVARVHDLRSMETDRTLVLLAARPLTRADLLAAEGGAAVGGALLLSIVAGCMTWCGVTLTGADLPLTAAVAGAGNTVPVTLLSAGAAILALGWFPRATVMVGILPPVGGFLFLVLARFFRAPEWVVAMSPFAHLAPVPAAPADWPGAAAMTVTAALLAVTGAVGYRRRDLLA